MLASEDKGRFTTQRANPRMALIDIHMPPEALTGSSLPADAAMVLSVPGRPELKVNLTCASMQLVETAVIKVLQLCWSLCVDENVRDLW